MECKRLVDVGQAPQQILYFVPKGAKPTRAVSFSTLMTESAHRLHVPVWKEACLVQSTLGEVCQSAAAFTYSWWRWVALLICDPDGTSLFFYKWHTWTARGFTSSKSSDRCVFTSKSQRNRGPTSWFHIFFSCGKISSCNMSCSAWVKDRCRNSSVLRNWKQS